MKISVVTVSFNAARTIERTIQSVREQEGVEVEHIIIDGASRDNTLAIVDPYRDKIAIVLSEPDRGVYDAMQKGLERATGQYCGFLNADDYLAGPNALATLAALTDKGRAAGVFGCVEQVDEAGVTRRRLGEKPFDEAQLRWGKAPPHPSVYLRTDLMRKVGGFDPSLRICGDMDIIVKVLDTGVGQFHHTAETIVKMQLGGISTSGWSAYKTTTAEMFKILTRAKRRPSLTQLRLRFLYKLRELVAA